jgi:hypothetical protein
VGCDKSKLPQEFLQVAHKAWFIDDDVQAAEALRSCRNEVAFSHCAYEIERVKGTARDCTGKSGPTTGERGARPSTWVAARAAVLGRSLDRSENAGRTTPRHRIWHQTLRLLRERATRG